MNRIPRLELASMVMITLLGTFTSSALANTIEKGYYEFADVCSRTPAPTAKKSLRITSFMWM